MSRLWVTAIGLTLAAGAAGSASIAAQGARPSPAPAPLTVTARCESRGGSSFLRVDLQNTGRDSLAVVPGFTPAGTQTHVVNSLIVAVIRIATGATEEYIYIDPKFAAFTGRSEPWVVPLAPGAMHSIEVPLKDFISGMTYASLEPLVATGGRLVFESKPGATTRPPRPWSGKVETEIEC